MATKEQKYTALNTATDIAKAFSQGGADKLSPGYVLEEVYGTLIRLMDQIESENKTDH
jgi:hypothetical protein